MSTLMDNLEPVSADPLLGLMLAVRRDTRADKVDLGVGIYKDADGKTPVMRAVKAAEEALIIAEDTKSYEGPQGNPLYCEEIGKLVLDRIEDRQTVFASPGGSGALFIGMSLARKMSPSGRIIMSAPTWPNHPGIAASLGYEIITYPYRSTPEGSPDIEPVLDTLHRAERGDVVLLQGPCHNPTGTDFTPRQWMMIADIVVSRGLLPLIDIAYQGFGQGLEEDMAPVRAFLSYVPEALLTYSCSKNFGIYRERTGALIIQGGDEKVVEAARGQAAAIIRSCYSMPPSHGPAIVFTILSTPELAAMWREELFTMRARLHRLRQGFAEALVTETGQERFGAIAAEKGMFSLLPLKEDAARALRGEAAIYMPDNGRINVAGLSESRVGEVAEKIAPYLKAAG